MARKFVRLNDQDMATLTSVQKALFKALDTELRTMDEDEPGYWASFQPEEGNDPMTIFFCLVGTFTVLGKFKIFPDGNITDREGVAEHFLK